MQFNTALTELLTYTDMKLKVSGVDKMIIQLLKKMKNHLIKIIDS